MAWRICICRLDNPICKHTGVGLRLREHVNASLHHLLGQRNTELCCWSRLMRDLMQYELHAESGLWLCAIACQVLTCSISAMACPTSELKPEECTSCSRRLTGSRRSPAEQMSFCNATISAMEGMLPCNKITCVMENVTPAFIEAINFSREHLAAFILLGISQALCKSSERSTVRGSKTCYSPAGKVTPEASCQAAEASCQQGTPC